MVGVKNEQKPQVMLFPGRSTTTARRAGGAGAPAWRSRHHWRLHSRRAGSGGEGMVSIRTYDQMQRHAHAAPRR